MLDIVPFLIKSILCSGIFFLFYRIVLYNRGFHFFNRIFLLSAFIVSILAGLIDFHFPVHQQETNRYLQYALPYCIYIGSHFPAGTTSFIPSLLTGYLTISLILSITVAVNVVRILQIRKNGEVSAMNGYQLVRTNAEQAPFSFLRILFWKHEWPVSNAIDQRMFQHECAHIQLGHTYDKLFTRLVTSFVWINPFYWLMQKELTVIHEFQADACTVTRGDTNSFAELLLYAHHKENNISPAQGFGSSVISRRLFMIKNDRSWRSVLTQNLLAFPLGITLLILTGIIVMTPYDTIAEQKIALDIKQRREIITRLVRSTDSNGKEKVYLVINKSGNPGPPVIIEKIHAMGSTGIEVTYGSGKTTYYPLSK